MQAGRSRRQGLAALVALVIMAGNALAVGTGIVDRVSGWYPAGTNLTVTATAGTNDELKGWSGDTNSATFGAATITFLVNAPKTITATFRDIMRTITATAGSNGSISPSGPVAVAQGDNQTFTITPSANYHILDVLVGGSSVGAIGSYTFTNVMSNATIASSFAIDTHVVTFQAGAHGSISGGTAVQTIDHGSNATPPTITATMGYAHSGWNGSYTSVTNTRMLTALYTTNEYTLTFNSAGGSAVSPIAQLYTTAITAPAAPTRTGYTFASWNPAVPATMPASNQTHTALWTTNDYSFIVSSERGTPTPVGTNWYAHGATVNFVMTNSPIIIPNDTKYDATGWVGTGSLISGTGTNGSFTITNNTTMTWQWSTNYWIQLDVLTE
ncbi:MAG TPA: hypothetical protein DCS43_12120 [Verrucomicrobia bacterium]|nr:hypothetical protein [Verrucomicrobiota bacterium]